MRARAAVVAVVATVLALLLGGVGSAGASTDDPLRDLPSRVDTSPDRMRFVRTGAVVAAVAVIAVAAAVLTRRDED